MVKCLIIHPDNRIEEADLNGYKDFSDTVGGMLEFLWVSNTINAYINENGKELSLPVNDIATDLCVICQTGLAANDFIVGPMIVFGLPDNEGKETDISDANAWQIYILAKAHTLEPNRE